MIAPVTRTHRLAVARAWDGRDNELDDFVRDWAETGVGDMSLHVALERLAQLVADAEGAWVPAEGWRESRRDGLLKIHSELLDELDQKETDEHAPILVALNDAYNLGAHDFMPKPPEQP